MMHFDFCVIGSGAITSELIQQIHSRSLSILLVTERTDILNSSIYSEAQITVVDRIHFLKSMDISIGNLILATRDDAFKKNVALETLLLHIENADIGQVTLISSAAVYGECPKLVDENVIPEPKNIYGLEKFKLEQVVRGIFEAKGSLKILRLGNVYGPKFHSGFIWQALNHTKNGTSIPIFSAGSQIRNFFHVEDLVEATIEILQLSKLGSTQIINVGDSKHYTALDVIAIIENVLSLNCSTLDLSPPIDSIHSSQLDTNLFGRLYSKRSRSLEEGIRNLLGKA